jgi:hypothetical protein
MKMLINLVSAKIFYLFNLFKIEYDVQNRTIEGKLNNLIKNLLSTNLLEGEKLSMIKICSITLK